MLRSINQPLRPLANESMNTIHSFNHWKLGWSKCSFHAKILLGLLSPMTTAQCFVHQLPQYVYLSCPLFVRTLQSVSNSNGRSVTEALQYFCSRDILSQAFCYSLTELLNNAKYARSQIWIVFEALLDDLCKSAFFLTPAPKSGIYKCCFSPLHQRLQHPRMKRTSRELSIFHHKRDIRKIPMHCFAYLHVVRMQPRERIQSREQGVHVIAQRPDINLFIQRFIFVLFRRPPLQHQKVQARYSFGEKWLLRQSMSSAINRPLLTFPFPTPLWYMQ